jgi:hypothetical protein
LETFEPGNPNCVEGVLLPVFKAEKWMSKTDGLRKIGVQVGIQDANILCLGLFLRFLAVFC